MAPLEKFGKNLLVAPSGKNPSDAHGLDTWNSRPRLQNLCVLPKMFFLNVFITNKLIFFKFLAFFDLFSVFLT